LPSLVAESRHGGLYVLHLFLIFYLFFDNSCQTNYLKIFYTDLCQIFSVGWLAMAVDDQYEISFLVPKGMLPSWQPSFVGVMNRTDFLLCPWLVA